MVRETGESHGAPFLGAHPWTCSRPLMVAALMEFVSWRVLIILLVHLPLLQGWRFCFWKVWGFPGDAQACSAEADCSAPLLLDHHPFAHDGGRGSVASLPLCLYISHGTRMDNTAANFFLGLARYRGFCCFTGGWLRQGRPKAGHRCPSCGGGIANIFLGISSDLAPHFLFIQACPYRAFFPELFRSLQDLSSNLRSVVASARGI